MEQGRVFIVTHGPIILRVIPNPDLAWPFEDINNCILKLPNKPSKVICGTGVRHKKTAEALRLTITDFCSLVGNADLVLPNKAGVILADGDRVEDRVYSCLGDNPELVKIILSPLLNTNGDSIIVADPELIKNFVKDLKRGTVYQFMLSGIVEI